MTDKMSKADTEAFVRSLFTGEGTAALDHDQMREYLGPPCAVPGYNTDRELEGGWSLREHNVPVARGYFSAIVPCPPNPVLSLNGQTFMSVTPMELESHWVPVSDAHGNVVIAGLGMAMIVINLLVRGSCDSIVVLEHSQELIDAFPDLLEGYTRDLWTDAIDDGYLTVIKADCKAELPQGKIAEAFGADRYHEGLCTHLYADIWPDLGTDAAVTDTQALCEQLLPFECSFWGQELALADALILSRDETPDADAIRRAATALKLPLSVLSWDDEKLNFYGKMIAAAVYSGAMR